MNDTVIIIAVFTAIALAFTAITVQPIKGYLTLAHDHFSLHSKRMDDIEDMLSHLSDRIDDVENDSEWDETYDDYDDPDYSQEFEYDDDEYE